jgi:hypothetical protein
MVCFASAVWSVAFPDNSSGLVVSSIKLSF